MDNLCISNVFRDKHKTFITRVLKHAPGNLSSQEPMRPSILFFILSGLDVLNDMDSLSSEEKNGICNWIYSQQVEPRAGLEDDVEELKKCGFYGSRTLTLTDCDIKNNAEYHAGHIAMTYSCLLSLVILGDDLGRVKKTAILKALKYLQKENGSFSSSTIEEEDDMRFVYCAVVICYILNDFSHINIEKTCQFITNSIGYDGGIGLEPNSESHGGSSFCAIASLYLMGKLESALSITQIRKLQRWLILRQQTGFQGRPNKEVDTCYSFWIAAALKDRNEIAELASGPWKIASSCSRLMLQIVGLFVHVNWEENRKSIILCQNSRSGGISKDLHSKPDILHTYFGLCGLSFMNESGLSEVNPALNMSLRACEHLLQIHKIWL